MVRRWKVLDSYGFELARFASFEPQWGRFDYTISYRRKNGEWMDREQRVPELRPVGVPS